ncbi:hypothetical protein NXS98_14265 [Fontisphaera persica]|nr:hypothetical protein [Fontisphaera persica]WCJ58873.1 hypothetical protein NXS98_14265 [Fontisphaera persica]
MKWRLFRQDNERLAEHYLQMAKGWRVLKNHYQKQAKHEDCAN